MSFLLIRISMAHFSLPNSIPIYPDYISSLPVFSVLFIFGKQLNFVHVLYICLPTPSITITPRAPYMINQGEREHFSKPNYRE